MEPISHAEISRIMAALIDRADKQGREHIVGIAVSSLLNYGPPGDRSKVLSDLAQSDHAERLRRLSDP